MWGWAGVITSLSETQAIKRNYYESRTLKKQIMMYKEIIYEGEENISGEISDQKEAGHLGKLKFYSEHSYGMETMKLRFQEHLLLLPFLIALELNFPKILLIGHLYFETSSSFMNKTE